MATGTMAASLLSLQESVGAETRAAFEAAGLARLSLAQTPLDDIAPYEQLRVGGWPGKILPIYSADCVIDPETSGFVDNLDKFGLLTNCDAYTWKGYLEAHRIRREIFKLYGCRTSLHHHASARAETIEGSDMIALFRKVCVGKASANEAELFRAVMLVEMAKMSADDGFCLHIEAGQGRGASVSTTAGRLVNVPMPVDYIRAARPLLQAFGDSSAFTIHYYTRDEVAMANQLVPLAEAYSAVRFGLSGGCSGKSGQLRQFRALILRHALYEAAAPLSGQAEDIAALPAQHETARRIDCALLAEQVVIHQLDLTEAEIIARRWALG